jgi:hypothetical protein
MQRVYALPLAAPAAFPASARSHQVMELHPPSLAWDLVSSLLRGFPARPAP